MTADRSTTTAAEDPNAAATGPGDPNRPRSWRPRVRENGAPSEGSDKPRRGWRRSARVRILAWVLFVLLLALSTVGATLTAILLSRAESDVVAAAQQEMREFTRFAEHGTDPATGQPFTRLQTLFLTHLQRQYPSENEILLAWTGGAVKTAEPLRQRQDSTADPFTSDAAILAVVQDPNPVGRFDSPAGEVYWNKTEVRTPAGERGTFITAYLLDEARESTLDTIRLIMLMSLVALGFSCVVAWVVASRIMEPITLVRQAAAAITEKRLDERIPVRGRDEIADLATSFNEMLDRLDRAFATQQQFVDDAGHELRTPITVIRGHLELMGEDPQERAETLALVDDELERMNRIVGDLLVLARAEQPDFIRAVPVGLADLTTTIYTNMVRLGDRQWLLEAVAEEEVCLDPQRITQAMLQLAANAVEHTETGQKIRLGSAVGQGSVTFWVADSGPGVATEDLQRIFGRFARASSDTAGHSGGAGLGLSIVAAIATAHGGRAWVANNPSGGARFGIEIPLDLTGTVIGASS